MTAAERQSELIDTRDMIVVHLFLRREFRLAPGLVRGVEKGETRRAATICAHLEFLTTFLHHHHVGEDQLLWPKLLERVPEELAPIVQLMEAQHERVGTVLQEIERVLPQWRSTARPAERDQLAGLLDGLYVSLCEHLDAEEERILPIAARAITEQEWLELGEEGVKKLRKADLPLALGMIQYEGDPQVVADIVSHTPWLVRSFVPMLSRRAFRRHALAVHGTATP